VFGQGMHGRGWRPDLLDLPGKMLVYSPTNKRPRRGRAFRVEPADVARAVAAMRGQVPELDEGSANAFWEAYNAEPAPEFIGGGGGGGPRGGRPQPEVEAPVFGAAKLRLVPTYPDDAHTPIADKDVALWELLGDFGPSGATAVQLAARAEAEGHQHCSQAWVRQRLAYWRQMEFVVFNKEGREERHWRTDVRDARKDA
jgi:hypothetical protein